ncbi:MAG: hypothetical protein ACYC27_12165 [Armatimonadota bacterium]
MSHRLFSMLSAVLCMVVITTGSVALGEEDGRMIKMENNLYILEIDRDNGAINRIYDKVGKVEIISEPRLADSFRLLLPLGQRQQANYILGRDQRLTTIEERSTGLTLGWAGPLKNQSGDPFDLTVVMRIEFEGDAVKIDMNVRNRTGYKLMEVWYPILGGLTGFGERKQTLVHIPWEREDNGANPDIFWNTRNPWNLGTDTPEITFECPGGMPAAWMDIYNKDLNRGIYFGLQDTSPRKKLFRVEMQPGIGTMRLDDTWPRPNEIDPRFPVGLIFCWVYYLPEAETKVGESFHGATAILNLHDGDWKTALAIHREVSGKVSDPIQSPQTAGVVK